MAADDIYPLIAVIERRAAAALAVERLVVAPAAVLAGEDVALADRDDVRLFTRAEVRALATSAAAGEQDRALETAARPPADAIDPALAAVLDAHGVTVTGAVARPGHWPVAGPTTVAALFEVAGGVLPGARLADAEATVVGDTGQTGTEVRRVRLDLAARPPSAVVLRPGDALHVPPRRDPVAGRTVEIAGAVRHPGTYTLVEGDRLSSLIDRAGGLTVDAYPLGAVFTREAEAQARRAWLRDRATAIRRALAEAMAGDRPPDGAAVQAVEQLLVELETAEPPGRLQVEADPERLRAEPSLDIVLQDGDRLVVPVRPLTVRVTGEVLSPAALQFRDGRQVGDYLRGAGGLTRAADTGRVFVVLPDGRAQPVRPSAWSHAPLPIPPGATIVVPRDPAPFRFLDLAGMLGELFGQLALGAAALVTLGE
jgi:protein involved in polysaccharide export with SLBB domain